MQVFCGYWLAAASPSALIFFYFSLAYNFNELLHVQKYLSKQQPECLQQ